MPSCPHALMPLKILPLDIALHSLKKRKENIMSIGVILNSIKFRAIGTIQKLVQRECENEEKKAILDAAIIDQLKMMICDYNIGWIGRLIINKLILPYIPELTQFIFDLVKAKVAGVTKENG